MKILILSYDLAGKYQEILRKINFNIAIADEAHYLKNPIAKRTEVLVPILA